MNSRLNMPLPKVGIRPVIDGRYGGVRESLEGQVMAMANLAKAKIEENCRHACGLPAECVVPDHCIGGLAESAECDRLFSHQDVGLTLTVTPCWCYGTETTDRHPTRPKAIWGLNGTERPGAVYLAAALAGMAQSGLPCFGIYGSEVQDETGDDIPQDVLDKILRFVRAGTAVATMRGTSYLSVGGTSMGIAGSVVDRPFFEQYLGMSVMSLDMTELERRIAKSIYDPKEYEAARQWLQTTVRDQDNYAPGSLDWDDEWDTCLQMALVMKDLMAGNAALKESWPEEARGHNALAAGFQGQRQWTDHRPNGDFMEAMLCSSFDWLGVREPFVVATENDSLNAVCMLFGHLLTGKAQLFSDVRTFWSPEAVYRVTGHSLKGRAEGGVIHLINSGPSALDWTGEQSGPTVKPWWQVTDADALACTRATTWRPAIREYFPGGGFSTDFLTKGEMPVTMSRINLVNGLGPVMQIAEGFAIDLPPEVHDALDSRTNPTWPTTWFVPRLTGRPPFDRVYEVMRSWGANHGAICHGHVGQDIVTLCSMLRIPVDMHNLDGVFRPAVWDRFGALEPQSADFRACANFGPLWA